MTQKQQLKRLLGKSFSIVVCVGLIVGLGIMRTPGEIAEIVSDPWIYMSLWIGGGLFVLLSVLTVAELFAITPRTGGTYVLVRHAYGPYPGFVVGWADWISYCGSIALKSVVVVEYMALLMPEITPFIKPLAVLTSTVFAALQLVGIRLAASIQHAAVFGIGLIMLSITVALFYGYFTAGTAVTDAVAAVAPTRLTQYGIVVTAVVYTYDGWFAATIFGGELKGGGRSTAIGSIKAILIVISIYVLLNLALVLAVPLTALVGNDLALSGAIEIVFGNGTGTLIIFAAIFILLAHHNNQYMMAPRIFYALSADGLGTERAAEFSEKGTPVPALFFSWIAMISLIMVGGFNFLLSLTAFLFVLIYISVVIGVFRLRRKEPNLERPYRAWGFPYVGIVCIIGWVSLAVFIAYSNPVSVAYALGLLAISVPAYLWIKRSNNPRGAVSSES